MSQSTSESHPKNTIEVLVRSALERGQLVVHDEDVIAVTLAVRNYLANKFNIEIHRTTDPKEITALYAIYERIKKDL
jgi:hypothetical protein